MPVILWNFALLKAGRAQLSTAHTSWYLLWLPPRPVLPSSAPPPGLLIWELPQELEDIHTSEYLTQGYKGHLFGYERISFSDMQGNPKHIHWNPASGWIHPLISKMISNYVSFYIHILIHWCPSTYPCVSIYLSYCTPWLAGPASCARLAHQGGCYAAYYHWPMCLPVDTQLLRAGVAWAIYGTIRDALRSAGHRQDSTGVP